MREEREKEWVKNALRSCYGLKCGEGFPCTNYGAVEH